MIFGKAMKEKAGGAPSFNVNGTAGKFLIKKNTHIMWMTRHRTTWATKKEGPAICA